MDVEEATATLNDYADRPLEELGEAVDELLKHYDSYTGIGEIVRPVPATISKYHRLSQLPKGIRWKVDAGELTIGQAVEVARLEDENDQWVLAYAIVDDEDASVPGDEWRRAVDEVLSTGRSMEDILRNSLGVASEKTVTMALAFDYWFRFKLCRAAWNRRENWHDLAYSILNDWLASREFESPADLREITEELSEIARSTSRQLTELTERLEDLRE